MEVSKLSKILLLSRFKRFEDVQVRQFVTRNDGVAEEAQLGQYPEDVDVKSKSGPSLHKYTRD